MINAVLPLVNLWLLKKLRLKSALIFLMTGLAINANAESVRLKIAAPLPILKHPEISKEVIRGLEAGGKIGGLWCDSWVGKTQLTLDFSIWDDGGNKDQALTAASQIVGSGHDAVIGHINSETAIPASVVYEQAGVLNLSLGATSPYFTERKLSQNFRLSMDDLKLAELMGERVKSFGVARPIFVHDGTSFGNDLVVGIGRSFADPWAEDVLVSLGSDGRPDSKSTAVIQQRLKMVSVLAIGGKDGFAETILDAVSNTKKNTFMGAAGLCSPVAVKKMVETQSLLYCASQDAKNDESVLDFDAQASVAEIYQREFHQPITQTAARAADAVGIVVQAMCQAKSTESKKMARQIKSADFMFQGIAGQYQFALDGSNLRAKGFLYRVDSSGMRLVSFLESN